MTSKNPFVHLHNHTEYSLLDGASRIKDIISKAKADGMPAVAITDHGHMYGAMAFYRQAMKAGIKPIMGCEFYLAPQGIQTKNRSANHLVLLAKDNDGYEHLVRLVSMANLHGVYYKPRIDKDLLKSHSHGLIALSGCIKGEIPQLILQEKLPEAEKLAAQYLQIMGEGNFYLEVQQNGLAEQDKVNAGLVELGRKLSIPLVATNDCHYLNREDAYAHEVLLCVQTGKSIHDDKRLRFGSDQFYFKTQEEMGSSFADLPQAIDNTIVIAERCHVEFGPRIFHFPRFTDSNDVNVGKLFDRKVYEGFDRSFDKIQSKNPTADRQVYLERLEYEMGVILNMGFADYFLVVADFIDHARAQHIPVGPGRGSAAGSLVAYCLGITQIDPIEHGLLFERFLNPERISMPDIDVDFCVHRREEIFKYLQDRYGKDHMARIITFGRLKARAAIRGVGRALDIALPDINLIASLVPDELNISLEEAVLREPKLQDLIRSRVDIADLFVVCKKLENLPSHASTHAAGVVIADRPLEEYLPLCRGKDGDIQTQFDMEAVEQIGLVKFDLLGLENLSVMDLCLQNIAAQGHVVPDLQAVFLDDPATYQLLTAGQTTGVFQLESPGMKGLLRKLQPTCFSDLIALIALYRPGPLEAGMVDDFIDRKHGRKEVQYMLPELAPILAETYGVILYQEQVMKIAVLLAGYTMGEADGLRKAMGKKIASMMADHRSRFIEGCVQNGHDRQIAGLLFEQIDKFVGYGFNKSHSAAYALIAYQNAFLKAHYPLEFMGAWLTCAKGDSEKIAKFIEECRAMNISVLPPDINCSAKSFTIENGRIRFGLLGIKNLGEKAVDEILEARAVKPFAFLSDFKTRVSRSAVNARAIEYLIKAGAFQSLGSSKQQLLMELNPRSISGPTAVDQEEIRSAGYEHEALGFYLSEHPVGRSRGLVQALGCVEAKIFQTARDGITSRVAGIVQRIKDIKTKRAQPMSFLDIGTSEGVINAVLFPAEYILFRKQLNSTLPMIFTGQVECRIDTNQLIIKGVKTLEQARADNACVVIISTDPSMGSMDAQRLIDILKQHPGGAQVFIWQCESQSDLLTLKDALRVSADTCFRRSIGQLPGVRAINIAYS